MALWATCGHESRLVYNMTFNGGSRGLQASALKPEKKWL